jgi:hypothetical protein
VGCGRLCGHTGTADTATWTALSAHPEDAAQVAWRYVDALRRRSPESVSFDDNP